MRVFQRGSQILGDSNQQIDLALPKPVLLRAPEIERADADVVGNYGYADGRLNALIGQTVRVAVLELFRAPGVVRLLGITGNFHDRPGGGNLHAFVKCARYIFGIYIYERKSFRFGFINGHAALDEAEHALELGIDCLKKTVSIQVQAGIPSDLIDYRKPSGPLLRFTVQAGIGNGRRRLVGDSRKEEKIITGVRPARLE